MSTILPGPIPEALCVNLSPPQPGYLTVLHHLGAAVSFICICFYSVLLTALTGKCVLTGYERFLYPARIASSVVQISVTICCILHTNPNNQTHSCFYIL